MILGIVAQGAAYPDSGTGAGGVGYRGVTTGGSTEDVVLALPPGTKTGDLLVLTCELNDENTVAAPSGFTEVPNSPAIGSVHRQSLFYKIAGANEGPVTVTDPGDHVVAALLAFSGIDTANPLRASVSDVKNDNSFKYVFPPTNDVEAGDLVIFTGTNGHDTTGSAVGEYNASDLQVFAAPDTTGIAQTTAGGGGRTLWLAGVSKTGATAQGDLTISGSQSFRTTMTTVFNAA